MKGTKPHLVIDNGAISKTERAPTFLSKDAKAEWRRIMPALVKRRILTVADLGSVENYCLAIGQVREMERLIQDEGHVLTVYREGKEGGEPVCIGSKKNPAVAVQADAMNRARQLAAELGLTPVSRARPVIRDDADDGDLGDLDL
ncbi:phage terminase small subunit P27 family [Bradyrhizobium sp. MOS002]|uniref:phage terminase small subunit P27 family n=1 Tax=Bradyrhizobium sp. MOS002 TaxID=2133947 RepID=UPI000D12CD59|nr:phage terminase small subunit P27 family [Bradyrhizobium sp. MOS002]PSO30210.1 phage terminase small subunit P27 family [Bradyrhizobium sp. MOS002]